MEESKKALQRIALCGAILLLASCSSNVRFSSRQSGSEPRENRGVPRQKPEAEKPAPASEEKPVPRPGETPADAAAAAPGAPEEGGYGHLFQEGVASYYAHEFNGRKTANGETFDMNDLTAAHQTLAFNTKVRVENQLNGKAVIVRINDRGPFKKDRIIDLSLSAARRIELIGPGSAPVKLYIVDEQ
jgi:rare lipoprotein A